MVNIDEEFQSYEKQHVEFFLLAVRVHSSSLKVHPQAFVPQKAVLKLPFRVQWQPYFLPTHE